ncbi:MAG: hypothetical protein CSA70_03645 [Rhodobacterales bacterium]|nr:MAG: hypothetical protein CSA70_03645 [Rhodobacterales bacterium]
MATTGERNTPQRAGDYYTYDLEAGAKINKGAIVCLNAGYAKAGYEAAGLVTVGRAEESVDTSLGDTKVRTRRGVFQYDNSPGADELTRADIDIDCFLVDDETVAKTDGGATRSVAGIVRGVEGGKVWVEF